MNMVDTLRKKALGLTLILATLLVTLGASACTFQLVEAEPVSAEQKSEEVITEKGDSQMTVTLIGRHEVKDFDAWKKVYDSSTAIRDESGVMADSIHRDLDNPNLVTVYHQFADAAAASAYAARLDSDQFRAMAEEVGIVLPVEVRLMTDVVPRPDTGSLSGTITLIASHEVKDFDAWKEMFDGSAELRKKAGFIAESVHRNLENPNLVTVYAQFADAEAARAHAARLDSEEFHAMAEKVGIVLPVDVFLMTDVK